MWCADISLNYETMIYFSKRLAGVPNYHYFQSEAPNGNNADNISALSYYTRCHLFVRVMVHQYISQLFVLRCLMNLLKMTTMIFEYFPLPAILTFGKDKAYVYIMKHAK